MSNKKFTEFRTENADDCADLPCNETPITEAVELDENAKLGIIFQQLDVLQLTIERAEEQSSRNSSLGKNVKGDKFRQRELASINKHLSKALSEVEEMHMAAGIELQNG